MCQVLSSRQHLPVYPSMPENQHREPSVPVAACGDLRLEDIWNCKHKIIALIIKMGHILINLSIFKICTNARKPLVANCSMVQRKQPRMAHSSGNV